MPVLAPGYSLLRVLFELLIQRQQPFHVLARLARRYGPVVRLGRGSWQLLIVTHPDLIRRVLVLEAEDYSKDRGLDATQSLLGLGLLTSEGEFHKRQRRMTQPAFHRSRLPHYEELMVNCARRCSESWRDGQEFDLLQQMMGLTLEIAAGALFGANHVNAAEIGEALDFCISQYTAPRLAFLPLLQRLPLPSTLLFRKHSGSLKRTVEAIIRERRRAPGEHHDLLSLLLNEDMSDEQLRDECLTLFLAGHETTANALTWTFYLLDRHPEIAQRVRAEVDAVIPSFANLPRLEFTEKVVRESMRLYPPSWSLGRKALRATELGGYLVPKNSTVILSQWVMHHHPDYYPQPERFSPDRWTPEFTQQLPRFAYFPFGGGPRICVAEHFARSEILLVLATLLREWTFRCEPGRPVLPQAFITLRPRGGLPGRVWRRDGPAAVQHRLGLDPNKRLNSRLNWEGLS